MSNIQINSTENFDDNDNNNNSKSHIKNCNNKTLSETSSSSCSKLFVSSSSHSCSSSTNYFKLPTAAEVSTLTTSTNNNIYNDKIQKEKRSDTREIDTITGMIENCLLNKLKLF